MTIEQCEKKNCQVYKAWKGWKNKEEELDCEDFYILAGIFSMRYPQAMRHCESARWQETRSGNYVLCFSCTSPTRSANNTVSNFLSRLEKQKPVEYYENMIERNGW